LLPQNPLTLVNLISVVGMHHFDRRIIFGPIA
jgi:hypothetical protein